MNTHPTTRRSWSHKSVRALIRSEGGGDPIEIIRAKSRSVVRWAKNLGWQGPPYDPLKLASLRGIRSKQSDGLFSAEAQLTPMDGEQLLLEFNPNRAPCRKNFSISHELVHTFFDDCFEMVHHRKSNPKAFDPQHEVEQLCQAGAAEILIPQDDFLLDLERLSRSLSIVPELCERYQASREAVARRILTFSRKPAALVFLSRRLKPVEKRLGSGGDPSLVPKLRILYSVPTLDFPVYLPAHKSAPDDSCVYAATLLGGISSGREQWNISGLGPCSVEAITLSVPETAGEDCPSVIALLTPDEGYYRR
jgi:hypothetical protein